MKKGKNIMLIISIACNIMLVIFSFYKNAVAEVEKTRAEQMMKIAEKAKIEAEEARIKAEEQYQRAEEHLKQLQEK